MERPGFTSSVGKVAVHPIKCISKLVKLLYLKEYYEQLPVTINNKTWFLRPKIHILIKEGKQITCN